MKQLSGSASAPTRAGEHRCVDFLSDVEAYPHWYPEVVRGVEVLERDADGRATLARATLRASVGPINRDLQLTLGVSRGPREVKLVRIAQDSADAEHFSVNWQVSGAQSGARIDLKLDAALDVPRLVPLGGVGDAMASGFVAAAVRSLDRSAG